MKDAPRRAWRRLALLLLAWPLLCLGAPAATAASRVDRCSWDRPGHDPFMGNVVAAVDRYTDIPADVRQRLQQRMAQRNYDDLVSIRRDSIEGRYAYDTRIRDMHFGAGTVCSETSRARWTEQMQERGLVYCDSGQCILVPTVCRNVSRITRRPTQTADTVIPVPSSGPPLGGETFVALAQPVSALAVAGEDTQDTFSVTGPLWVPPLTIAQTPPRGHTVPLLTTGDAPPPIATLPDSPPPAMPVPEPTTTMLLLAGLGWLALRQRRLGGRRESARQTPGAMGRNDEADLTVG
jgi:hypothetical protein